MGAVGVAGEKDEKDGEGRWLGDGAPRAKLVGSVMDRVWDRGTFSRG